jgi:hypothetical protein
MSKRKKKKAPTLRQQAATIARQTGLSIEEILAESARREALEAANADPLPGPLAMAFPARSIRVGLFSVRPVVHADWATLRLLDSPLLKQIQQLARPAAEREVTPFSDQEEWEMILVFLLEPRRAQREAQDREGFARMARDKIGHGLNPFVVEMLKGAVVKQFEVSCITAVQFASQAGKDSGNEVFTRPPAGATTGSAGGSNISVVSSEASPA